jgi:hypothetical protein
MDEGDDLIRSTAAFAQLRSLGRATSSLTYQEVDRHLPKSVTSSTDIDAWLSALNREGVEIVDADSKSE